MKEMKKEKYEKLTEKDFCIYIKNISKQCKLVILARAGSIKYCGIHHVEQLKLYYVY